MEHCVKTVVISPTEPFAAMSSGHLLSAPQRLLGAVRPAQLPGRSLPTQPSATTATTAAAPSAAAATTTAAADPPSASGSGYGSGHVGRAGRRRAVETAGSLFVQVLREGVPALG